MYEYLILDIFSVGFLFFPSCVTPSCIAGIHESASIPLEILRPELKVMKSYQHEA